MIKALFIIFSLLHFFQSGYCQNKTLTILSSVHNDLESGLQTQMETKFEVSDSVIFWNQNNVMTIPLQVLSKEGDFINGENSSSVYNVTANGAAGTLQILEVDSVIRLILHLRGDITLIRNEYLIDEIQE